MSKVKRPDLVDIVSNYFQSGKLFRHILCFVWAFFVSKNVLILLRFRLLLFCMFFSLLYAALNFDFSSLLSVVVPSFFRFLRFVTSCGSKAFGETFAVFDKKISACYRLIFWNFLTDLVFDVDFFSFPEYFCFPLHIAAWHCYWLLVLPSEVGLWKLWKNQDLKFFGLLLQMV